MKKPRVALVHDYLVTFGGAERVLVALHEIWPTAPVYLLAVDKHRLGQHWSLFRNWDLRPSWWQKLPFSSQLISPFRFLLPYIWESFNLNDYDLVVSSSAWAMSKAVLTLPGSKHICYCHTPPRFLYHYPGARLKKKGLIRWYATIVNARLREYDYISSQRVDALVANSHEVAERIQKFWRRTAKVIPPPIDYPKILTRQPKKDFYLYVSRLVAYKHPFLAIKACQQLGRKLVIVGSGPLASKVKQMAANNPNIDYRGHVDDISLQRLYQQARAVIFPVESEDFGMVPLEAAAWGTPTIAYFSGGAKETILPQKTGLYFHKLTSQTLLVTLRRFEKQTWSSTSCRRWAARFRRERFKQRFAHFAEKILATG